MTHNRTAQSGRTTGPLPPCRVIATARRDRRDGIPFGQAASPLQRISGAPRRRSTDISSDRRTRFDETEPPPPPANGAARASRVQDDPAHSPPCDRADRHRPEHHEAHVQPCGRSAVHGQAVPADRKLQPFPRESPARHRIFPFGIRSDPSVAACPPTQDVKLSISIRKDV